MEEAQEGLRLIACQFTTEKILLMYVRVPSMGSQVQVALTGLAEPVALTHTMESKAELEDMALVAGAAEHVMIVRRLPTMEDMVDQDG